MSRPQNVENEKYSGISSASEKCWSVLALVADGLLAVSAAETLLVVVVQDHDLRLNQPKAQCRLQYRGKDFSVRGRLLLQMFLIPAIGNFRDICQDHVVDLRQTAPKNSSLISRLHRFNSGMKGNIGEWF